MDKSPVFGIDLGTTYSCIAYVDEFGRPVVVPNAEGGRVTPSVVQFDGDERNVGSSAKASAVLFPGTTVEMVKRFMGKSEGFYFEYQGVQYKPEEISSYILRKLVKDAEQHTGITIKDVVITCPAYFGIPEREATANAGVIAGLNVLSIVNEPTAAAISYGANEQAGQTVLVYDLGGGTFDVTVIRIEADGIRVVCTGGDHELGGKDWDGRLVNYFVSQWQQQTGSSDDPLSSPETMQDLYIRAEQGKIMLTGKDKVDVPVNHEGARARITLTREVFDELTSDLLERTLGFARDVLSEAAKRGETKIDQLLLVGGSTRMPQVRQRLMKMIQDEGLNIAEPRLHEPEESVAKGAAIYGHRLSIQQEIVIKLADEMGVRPEEVEIEEVTPSDLEKAQQDVAEEFGLQIGTVKTAGQKIIDVTSRSFGVIAWDPKLNAEIVSNIIRINDSLPVEKTQRFGTMEANQDEALIQIVDNLSSDDTFDPALSRKLSDEGARLPLPPGLPKGAPIEITFRLNRQGRLEMYGRDLTGGREIAVELQTEAVMSVEEREEAVARSKSLVIS